MLKNMFISTMLLTSSGEVPDAGLVDAGTQVSSSASEARAVVFPETEVVVPAAAAQEIVVTDAQVPELALKFTKAVKDQEWQYAAMFGLMLLVWVLRKILLDSRIRALAAAHDATSDDKKAVAFKPSDIIPWVTVGLSIATASLLSIQSGIPWRASLVAGGMIGLATSGGWSLLGKHAEHLISFGVEKALAWWAARKQAALEKSKAGTPEVAAPKAEETKAEEKVQ